MILESKRKPKSPTLTLALSPSLWFYIRINENKSLHFTRKLLLLLICSFLVLMIMMMNQRKFLSLALLIFITLPVLVHSECSCDMEEETEEGRNKPEALKLKFIAIASILVMGALGVCIPIFGNLNPEKYIFIMIKAFAAGVILSTGCMHVLADAIENLNSPCLNQDTWGYPWAIFIMMVSVLVTFMLDKIATSYYNRSHFINKEEGGLPVRRDQEQIGEHAGHVHVHTHATHGHSHGSALLSSNADDAAASSDLIRHRVVSQVLEFGIVVHSVIIGMSLGTSESPSTIKPLIAALTFHQFFEGLGLGGCISQAELKKKLVMTMVVFFSLTTPIGIGIGIGISNIYNENSPTSLIVEGIFNAVSSGILICMALVDLLAADFTNPKLQSNGRLQMGAFISVFLGAGCMALLAKWA